MPMTFALVKRATFDFFDLGNGRGTPATDPILTFDTVSAVAGPCESQPGGTARYDLASRVVLACPVPHPA
jgi:hypothetical protein